MLKQNNYHAVPLKNVKQLGVVGFLCKKQAWIRISEAVNDPDKVYQKALPLCDEYVRVEHGNKKIKDKRNKTRSTVQPQ